MSKPNPDADADGNFLFPPFNFMYPPLPTHMQLMLSCIQPCFKLDTLCLFGCLSMISCYWFWLRHGMKPGISIQLRARIIPK